MEPIVQSAKKADEKLSLKSLAFAVGTTVFSYIFLLMLACPNLLARQLEKGWWPVVLISLAFHLFLSGFEYFFHRYVLHRVVFKWLKKFYRDHSLHHALTVIFRKKPNSNGSVLAKIVNHYPITEEKQYESSFFPYWGLAGFALFFSPLIMLLQWLLPHVPIILGSFAAMTFSYCLYELLHALEHVPYETFWKKFVKNPRFGNLGRKAYGFHQFHHANIMCNMAISGFFGLPVFDWLFKTYKQPRELLFDGTLASEEDLSSPKPCWLIRWLDGIVQKPKAA